MQSAYTYRSSSLGSRHRPYPHRPPPPLYKPHHLQAFISSQKQQKQEKIERKFFKNLEMESYGTNPTQKKDDMYGVHGTGGGYDAHGVTGDQVTTGVGHGTTGGHVTGGGYGATGQEQMMRPEKEEHGGGILHRSGSSGSSSSEDDGMGGRRKKKGLKEKIKEKLPGGDKTDEHVQEHGTTTATGGYGTAATTTAGREEPEKKGMMEKIKEKLPGHH